MGRHTTELLKALNELPSVSGKEKRGPKAKHLTRKLNRIRSALADYGIKVQTGDDYRTATQKTILCKE